MTGVAAWIPWMTLLGALAGPAAEPPTLEIEDLVCRMSDESFEVREGAFGALRDRFIRDPERTAALLPADHPDPETRNYCAKLRARLPFERAYRDVLAIAADRPDVMKAVEAACGLESFPDGHSLLELAHAAGRKGRRDHAVMVAVGRLIGCCQAGLIGHPRDDRLLASALRTVAVPETAHLFVPYLASPDDNARSIAGVSLRMFGDSAIVVKVQPLLDAESRDVRDSAFVAYAALADAGHADAIARRLEDPSPRVRFAAIEALERLRSMAHLEAIARCLSDTDAGNRVRAAKALMAMKDPDARRRIEALRLDADPFVRRSAAGILDVTKEGSDE